MSEPDHLPQLLGPKGNTATNDDSRRNDSSVHNASQGAQIIQTGFSERWLIVLLIMVSFAALIFAGIALHEAAESANLKEIVRTNNAKIEILQYDHNTLKAQLVAKGVYQATEH